MTTSTKMQAFGAKLTKGKNSDNEFQEHANHGQPIILHI
jgi:hypothetical protein